MSINRLKYNFLRALILLLLATGVFTADAQFYNGSNMTFGKNRVQYNEFMWTYYKFDDFDTYFYLNGKDLAIYLSKYATEEIPIIEQKMGVPLDKKIQFLVFNNLTDLKQSNIGLAQNSSYNTGGITRIVGSRVMVYFDGNYKNFERQIRAAITEVLFNEMMFGGSLGKQVKTSALFTMPDWYKEGYISYMSRNWDTEIDNLVRDGILSGRYKKLNNLSGDDAVVAGHSFWNFIANQYSPSAITNIILMTSASNNLKKGFLYVLGLSYDVLIKEWYNYYEAQYKPFANLAQKPKGLLPIRYKTDVVYGQPRLNPQGDKLAYTTNERGKYRVFIYDLKKKKKHAVFKAGVMIDTKTDYSYPLLAWHPSGLLLAFIIERKGMPRLYLYNVEEKKTMKQNLYGVQKVTGLSYSDDGRFLVMSAVQGGNPDIFVFNVAASSFEQITRDSYTDLNPHFLNHSSKIIFSSNRLNDTLGVNPPDNMIEQPSNFDLFVYDYANHNPVLKRITKTPLTNEFNPVELSRNTISYLSDENGIVNQSLAQLDSAVSSVDTTIHYRYFINNKTVTNYSRSIYDLQVSRQSGKQALVYFENGKTLLFVEDAPSFNSASPVSLTMTSAKIRRIKKFQQQQNRINKTKPKPVHNAATSSQIAGAEKKQIQKYKRFLLVYADNNGNEVIGKPKTEKVVKTGNNGQLIVVNSNLEEEDKFTLPKRRNYYTEYYLDQMVSQVDFNYLNYSYQPFTGGGGPIYLNPGFNLFFQLGVTDLMENYRLIGGVRFNFSFINNEYLASFADLHKRLDKEIIFHRNTLESNVGAYNVARVHTHELFYILKWPFNEALSLRGTLHYRNDAYVMLATDQPSLDFPNTYENWGGLKAELVFDGTRNLGLNLYRGWRWKIFAEYNQLIGKEFKNLIVLGFDFRNYQKIYRNFIWANRIAGSTSFGNNKLIYYMGGVDNWISPRFNYETPIDHNQNYGYQTLATNMRGFYQNIRNGNSFAVINSELRFPVFQFFSKTPLSSGFLRNFQLIAFGDVGTAWTGPQPWSPLNSIYTNYVDSGPYHILVTVQKEPLVGGVGLGARVQLFGYFIRGDVSWGLEDYHINKPVYYLSFSLDF